MISQDKAVVDEYLAGIKNLDRKNPRFMILFSGPPGIGKSTVAKAIEEEFGAIRLENDALRRIIKRQNPELSVFDMAKRVYGITDGLRERISNESANGLLVIDSSIDRRADRLLNFAETYGYERIVLAFDIDETEHERRIRDRGGHPFADLKQILSYMKQRRDEQASFIEKYTPDFIIAKDTEVEEILQYVRGRIEKIA